MTDQFQGNVQDQRGTSAIATRTDDLLCPECGYSLRALESARCPECGLKLDFIDAPTSAIAWVERRRRGRVRTYVATALTVGFRNKRFCREIFRPVSYPDAQRFRWVSVAIVAAAIIACGLDYVFNEPAPSQASFLPSPPPESDGQSLVEFAINEYGGVVVAVVGVAGVLAIVLSLTVATGLPSYLFHTRRISTQLQNRAIALSYYTCGAFAVALAVFLAIIYAAWVTTLYGIETPPSARDRLVLSAGAVALGGVIYWLTLVLTARRTLLRSSAALRVAVLLPPLWLIAGGLVLVGIPGVIAYLWLIIDSFH